MRQGNNGVFACNLYDGMIAGGSGLLFIDLLFIGLLLANLLFVDLLFMADWAIGCINLLRLPLDTNAVIVDVVLVAIAFYQLLPVITDFLQFMVDMNDMNR